MTAREWNDDRLVAAMRTDEGGSFEEFFGRFAPLLRQEASCLRIQPALREEAVIECLEETAMSLTKDGATMPGSLAGYLVVSLRRKHLNRLRGERRREKHEQEAAQLTQASEPATGDDRSREFGARLLDHLGAEERLLVTWMGEQVPLREVAQWLGISHAAARQRVARLRAKLRVVLNQLNAGDGADDA